MKKLKMVSIEDIEYKDKGQFIENRGNMENRNFESEDNG